MALGKISKQELSEELYNSLVKQTDMNISTTPADVEISGRTLVNLLGRAGNAIYKQFDSGDAYGTVGYENDAYTLTNTVENSWITTLNTDHNFTKGKYYISVSEIYHVSGNDSFVSLNCKSDGVLKNIHFTTNEVNKWVTCWLACKCGDPLDGHPKPYIALATSGANPSAKFRNARVYEITEAEYNALDGLTREQVGQKYPYVDDVKCVVNPYVECNENLLENAHWGLISATSPNPESPLTYSDSGIICATYVKLEAEKEYTINIENQGSFQASFQLPNGVDLINPEQSPTGIVNTRTIKTTNDRTTLVLLINTESPTNATAKDIMNKITAKDIKVTVAKGSAPKLYEECHNSRMMFETKLYNGEKITRDNDGSYVKNSEWAELVLDGSTDAVLHARNEIASKQIRFENITQSRSQFDSVLVRYDGSVITPSKDGAIGDKLDGIYASMISTYDKNIYMSVPNNLTGWGDTYIPTIEEIRAFFLGWTMYAYGVDGLPPYNGSGEKYWIKLHCGIGEAVTVHSGATKVVSGSYTTICPTTRNNMGYTPYKLIYKKITPTIEEVKTHGSLVVKDDISTEVNSGLILGENIDIQLHTDGLYYINGTYSLTDNRLQHSIKVYDEELSYPIINYYNSSIDSHVSKGCAYSTYSGKNSKLPILCDYMIYKPDTVTYFPCEITTPKKTKQILTKTIQELSNINEKLSTENRRLKNKIENLPQVSNPNLLINGDFQVWQRGTIFSSTATEYCADRWVKTNITVTKAEKGMKVKANVSGQWIVQRIERTSGYLSSWLNNNITISSKIDGKIYTYTTVCMDKVVNYSYVMDFVSFDYGDNTNNCGYGYLRIKFHDTLEHTIEWVKIEIGGKATPFSPRTYAEELTMCQRYYEVGTIYAQTDSTFRQYLTGSTFKTEKRVVPTVTIVNGSVSDLNGVISTNIILHTNGGASINGINLVRTSDNSNIFSSGKIYTYKYTADAEIY